MHIRKALFVFLLLESLAETRGLGDRLALAVRPFIARRRLLRLA